MSKMRLIIQRNSQLKLLFLFVLVCISFGFINPGIIALSNIYSLFRAAIIPALYALAVCLFIAQGGIDMSFGMIGSFASYATILLSEKINYMSAPLVFYFGLAILFAVILYLLNWLLIDKMHMQAFITTLGVQSMLKGFVLAFIGTNFIYTLPESIASLGKLTLDTAQSQEGITSDLHFGVIVVVIAYLFVHFLLEYSSFGRKIYAIGNEEDAAKRAGINVSKIRLFSFIIAAILCAIAGVLHDALSRTSMPVPTDVVGQELSAIAAVVLGNGAVQKAKNTVPGTLIGVLLLQFINTNLIMLGVPSYWQQLVSGLVVFFGLIIQMSEHIKIRVPKGVKSDVK